MWLLIADEDNWRNDYPDEEDFFHSDSDDEGQHSRAAYRYHDSYGKQFTKHSRAAYRYHGSYGKQLTDTMILVLQSRGKKEPSEMGSQNQANVLREMRQLYITAY